MVKTPFSRSLSCYTRPPFSTFFSSTRPYFNKKSKNFPSFPFKMPNFGKFSVLNPTNRSKFSSESFNLGQKSVLKAETNIPKFWYICLSKSSILSKQSLQQAPKFCAEPFYKPPFQALWATYPCPNQSWVFPLGRLPENEPILAHKLGILCDSPVSQNVRPVRLRLPVPQKSTKSLKTLLVSHAKTFEMTKQT